MCWEKIVVDNSDIYLHKIKYHDWLNHTKMNTRIHKDNCPRLFKGVESNE